MKFKDQLIRYIKDTKYNIGFVDGSLKDVIEIDQPIKVNWLKHSYKDRWFADPFILDVTDKEIWVLVEEWYDPINRGRISKLIIDKHTYKLKDIIVLLELESHLSFPAIRRAQDGIYIYPENSVTGKLTEYKYIPEKEKLEISSIIANEPLTDAIQTDIFGEQLLFSTRLPDANGKNLYIYQYSKKNKTFKEVSQYHYSENLSRSAGDFFKYGEKIYRPSQVCIKSYGDAVSIQEVNYSNGHFYEKEVRKIYSPHPDLDLGFHTFNIYKDIIVVDAVGYRNAKLCHLLRILKHIGKHIKNEHTRS